MEAEQQRRQRALGADRQPGVRADTTMHQFCEQVTPQNTARADRRSPIRLSPCHLHRVTPALQSWLAQPPPSPSTSCARPLRAAVRPAARACRPHAARWLCAHRSSLTWCLRRCWAWPRLPWWLYRVRLCAALRCERLRDADRALEYPPCALAAYTQASGPRAAPRIYHAQIGAAPRWGYAAPRQQRKGLRYTQG